MLNNFKKKRVNKSAAVTMKKNATAHRAKNKPTTLKTEPVDSESSNSEYSDSSSDSDYEEILISNLNKTKIKEDKQEIKQEVKQEVRKEELPPLSLTPLKLEREQTANHSNHFTGEQKSEPIDIPKVKKKSKRVVIKKYYNYKPKNERLKPEQKPVEQKPEQKPEPRLNYLGFNTSTKTDDTRAYITNRIFNW